MATVSDELVERVAEDMANGMRVTFHERAYARSAIAALSTPEFVLPLAEEMLRGARFVEVIPSPSTMEVVLPFGYSVHYATLLDAYRAAKGE